MTPAAVSAPASPVFAYTHLQPDGNRWMPGRGALPRVRAIDIRLDGEPAWIVGAAPSPSATASIWVAVLADGRVRAFAVADDSRAVRSIPIHPARLPAGLPPLLRLDGETASLVTAPNADASRLSPPALIDGSRLAYLNADGDLVIPVNGVPARQVRGGLPDARILTDGTGRLLVLTQATDRYAHGVLGDRVEAGAIALLDLRRPTPIRVTIEIPPPAVVEGLAPIWAPFGDGIARDIIVTISDDANGGRAAVYDESGRLKAVGPGFGFGGRWRHPLAVAEFGPQHERELAVIRTPHIGGIVEFYRMDGRELRIAAQIPGLTSHVIGSRNLDLAVAGDVDGDGRIEVLAPVQSLDALGAVRRTPAGAELAWTVPLGERLSTNLSAATLSGNRLAVAAGLRSGILRVWIPDR